MLKMKNKMPRLSWPLLVLIGAALVAMFLITTKPRPAPVQVEERAWLVGTVPVSPQALSPQATVYGRIESLSTAQLNAAVAADVISVEVVEGDSVTKGDLLVRLDEREARLNLSQREADVIDAEARIEAEKTRSDSDQKTIVRERRLLRLTRDEVARLQDLLHKKLGSQSALDNARQAMERQALAVAVREQTIAEHPARMAQAEAALMRAHALREQAELDLSRCEVRAPFSGRVARRSVATGRRVKVGDSLLSMYDDSAMLLRALIPERHLPALRDAIRMQWPLRVSGRLDGEPVEGTLRGLVGEVEADSGGVAALFDIEAPPGLLQQGRFLEMDLILAEREGVIALPHEAVYGAKRVYIVDESSRMRAVEVERLGATRGGDDETLLLVRSESLQKGMQVVSTQLPNAVEGLLVRVSEGRRE